MSMTDDAARATGEAMPGGQRDIGDACDVVARARSLNELMFMAGESIRDREMANAITTGADAINDLLLEVRAILDANLDRKAGAA